MKNILIILGTAREGRQSEKVAKFIYNYLQQKNDVTCQLLDVVDFVQSHSLGLNGQASLKWRESIIWADAIIIVSPEYNHSFPGELKLLLDSETTIYRDKLTAICGVSSGAFGGARMIEQLKLVLHTLGFKVITESLFFAQVQDIFLKDGTMHEQDKWQARVDKLLVSLLEA